MKPSRSNSDSHIHDKSISLDIKQQQEDNNMLYLTKKENKKDQDKEVDDIEQISKKPDNTTHTQTDEDLPNSYAKLNQLSGRKSAYPEDIEEEPNNIFKYQNARKTNNSLFQ